MNHRAEITELEDKLKLLKEEQKKIEERCSKHEWTEPVYDPYTETEFEKNYHAPSGGGASGTFVEKTKDRWKRECLHCGKVEYAYEQKPIVYAPDFK